jgi:hypothetical protein
MISWIWQIFKGLRTTENGKRSTSPSVPVESQPHVAFRSGKSPLFVSKTDAWEVGDTDFGSLRYRFRKDFLLHYRDNEGLESKRRIQTKYFFEREDGSLSVFAFCHQRQANRAFITSRMVELVDAETGEVWQKPHSRLLDAYRESPVARLDGVTRERAAELTSLVFVARADGQMRKKQKEPIIRFLRDAHAATLNDVTDEGIDQAVSEINGNQQDFRRAIKDLQSRSLRDRTIILNAIQEIASTRKSNRGLADAAVKIAMKSLERPSKG